MKIYPAISRGEVVNKEVWRVYLLELCTVTQLMVKCYEKSYMHHGDHTDSLRLVISYAEKKWDILSQPSSDLIFFAGLVDGVFLYLSEIRQLDLQVHRNKRTVRLETIRISSSKIESHSFIL